MRGRARLGAITVLALTGGLAHAGPGPNQQMGQTPQVVQKDGPEAAALMSGAGDVFSRFFGPAGVGKIREIFYRGVGRDTDFAPSESSDRFSARSNRQVGRSRRQGELFGGLTGTWASQIRLDPRTGHGRLKAVAHMSSPGRSSGQPTTTGGSLVNGPSGKRVFDIQADGHGYTATMKTSVTQQPVKVRGRWARFWAERKLKAQGLPRDQRKAVLDGERITTAIVRTRMTAQPQPSLPRGIRPPSETKRSVGVVYQVGQRGLRHVGPVKDLSQARAKARAIQAAVPAGRR